MENIIKFKLNEKEATMENLTKLKLNRRRWAVQLALTIGMALLFLTALLWGLQGVTPVRADPGDLYVDGASGQDIPACGTTIAPCQTISYTLNSQASDGDAIFIATGTYTENLEISGITLTLQGGYTISGTQWISNTGETIIDGGNADRVFFIHGGDSVLANLTIIGGAADSLECWGDAVWITNGDVTIRSSTIKDNNGGCNGIEVNHDFGPAHLALESSAVSDMQGSSALHLWGEFASATITDTTFLNNTSGDVGGAIHIDGNSSAVISNSQVYSNTATVGGGGIAVSQSTLNVFNSSVMNNSVPNGQSGGIDVRSDSTVNAVDSIIAANSTRDHGGAATVDPGATLNLTNTLITGNSTTSGNANAFGVNGDMAIVNSTISDNNPQGAQAVILWSGHLTITNSILWNSALSLQGDPPCPTCFTVTYSDIEGGWTGTGNINTDPLFIGGGNYHLQMGSSCIDAGTNSGASDHDLEQRQRPQDGDGDGTATADMGAYEFRLYRIYLPITLKD